MFGRGLKQGLQHKVAPFDSSTVEEVFRRALIIERRLNEFQTFKEKDFKAKAWEFGEIARIGPP